MVKFRHKTFSVLKAIKSAPGVALGTATLGVSSLNLATNMSRHHNDAVYQKQQLKAMDQLSNSMGGLAEKLDETKTISVPVRVKERESRWRFFGKDFSELEKFAETSEFYDSDTPDVDLVEEIRESTGPSERTVSKVSTGKNSYSEETVTQSGTDPEGILFDLEGNVEDYSISCLLKNGVLVLYLNNPEKAELEKIDSILRDYCREHTDANFSSTKKGESYVICLSVIPNHEKDVPLKLIRKGFKLNICEPKGEKRFSIVSDTVTGALFGAGVGTHLVASDHWGGDIARKRRDYKNSHSGQDGYVKSEQGGLSLLATTTVIGAGLGLLVGISKHILNKGSQHSSLKARLMDDIVDQLKKTGFKEGTHFTRDPKIADRLKTKVAISITRYSGDMKFIINTFADNKLDGLTKNIIKTIPNMAASTQNAKNKFNEFIITTVSDGSADAGLIAFISERFIRGGYPVYLVEVG